MNHAELGCWLCLGACLLCLLGNVKLTTESLKNYLQSKLKG